MLKSHFLVNDRGFTACGRDAFNGYLISVDDANDVTCKMCQRLTKRASDGLESPAKKVVSAAVVFHPAKKRKVTSRA